MGSRSTFAGEWRTQYRSTEMNAYMELVMQLKALEIKKYIDLVQQLKALTLKIERIKKVQDVVSFLGMWGLWVRLDRKVLAMQCQHRVIELELDRIEEMFILCEDEPF
jgi:hypothetical protein